MITTVTLDPRILLQMEAPGLAPGRAVKTVGSRTTVQGVGVEIGAALRALGQPTVCTGISYDGNRQQLDDHLEFQTLCGRFVTGHGYIPTDVILTDPTGGGPTVLHGEDPPVHPTVVEQYLDALRHCARQSKVVVFSGRIPGGLDEGIYRRSLQALKKLPVKTVLWGEGKGLREALRQKPTLVGQSLEGLRDTFGVACGSREDTVRQCRTRYTDKGVEAACIVLEQQGVLLVTKDRAFYAESPNILYSKEKGGKAGEQWLVAGLCKGLREDRPADEMLRCALAAHGLGQSLSRRGDGFARLMDRVMIKEIHVPQSTTGAQNTKTGRKQKTR